MTLKYQWLFLLTFIDPIFHPLILIRRIKVMRVVDKEWRSTFSLYTIFKKSNETSKSNDQKHRFEKKARPTNLPTTHNTHHFGHVNRSAGPKISPELKSMLRILEEEKRAAKY